MLRGCRYEPKTADPQSGFPPPCGEGSAARLSVCCAVAELGWGYSLCTGRTPTPNPSPQGGGEPDCDISGRLFQELNHHGGGPGEAAAAAGLAGKRVVVFGKTRLGDEL